MHTRQRRVLRLDGDELGGQLAGLDPRRELLDHRRLRRDRVRGHDLHARELRGVRGGLVAGHDGGDRAHSVSSRMVVRLSLPKRLTASDTTLTRYSWPEDGLGHRKASRDRGNRRHVTVANGRKGDEAVVDAARDPELGRIERQRDRQVHEQVGQAEGKADQHVDAQQAEYELQRDSAIRREALADRSDSGQREHEPQGDRGHSGGSPRN